MIYEAEVQDNNVHIFILYSRGFAHGAIWQRGAFDAEAGGSVIQPGAMLDEYNAYLLCNLQEGDGHNQSRDWYNLLRRPLKVTRDLW